MYCLTPRAGRGGGAGRAAEAEQAMGSKMGMGFAASTLAVAAAVIFNPCHIGPGNAD